MDNDYEVMAINCIVLKTSFHGYQNESSKFLNPVWLAMRGRGPDIAKLVLILWFF